MHRLDDFGSPVGMVCMAIATLLGAAARWLNDYAGLIGTASSIVFGTIGTIYVVKTYRLRLAEHKAKMRALEAKPCPGPTAP